MQALTALLTQKEGQQRVDDDPETFDEDSEHYVNAVIESSSVRAVPLKQISLENESDPEFPGLKEALLEGKWEGFAKKWETAAGGFSLTGSILTRGEQIYVPLTLRKKILAAAEGHPGRDKLIKRLREKVW